MTGFARVRGVLGGRPVVLQISSVNHRHLDIVFHAPYELQYLETTFRNVLKEHVERGRIKGFLHIDESCAMPTVRFVEDNAREYLSAYGFFCRELGVESSASMTSAVAARLASAPYVVVPGGAGVGGEELEREFEALCRQAVERFVDMRRREGAALVSDLRRRVAILRSLRDSIEKEADSVVEYYRNKLAARLGELDVDERLTMERLAVEVALIAERSDVSEELTRISSHLDQVEELLDGDGPCGRKLVFLCQELHREINTTSSKLHGVDLRLYRWVVEFKSELAKIREQVENIE